MANKIDTLRELLRARSDAKLAEMLGLSAQAICHARMRNRLSERIYDSAANLLGVSRDEMDDMFIGSVPATESSEMDSRLLSELGKTISLNQQMYADTQRLHSDKEELLRENNELKLRLARMECPVSGVGDA